MFKRKNLVSKNNKYLKNFLNFLHIQIVVNNTKQL